MTQGQVEQRIGIDRTWLSKLEADKFKKPDRERLEKLARLYQAPPELFLSLAGYRTGPVFPVPRLTPLDRARSLVASLEDTNILLVRRLRSLPSGGPGGFDDPDPSYVPYMPQDFEKRDTFVAYTVVGDCLEPDIRSGDTVIVNKTASWRTGQIVVVDHDGELLVKILEDRSGELWLIAHQHREPIRVDDSTVIIGVVRWSGREH